MAQLRVQSVLNTLSDEATAFPTFFHRDLSYLLALEVKDVGTLSAVWQARVERWKLLLAWWLLGEVDEETLPVQPPLLEHVPRDPKTGAPAVDSVTWLLRRGGDGPAQPVGTLSPFVLVRPSPDSEDDRRFWEQAGTPWHDARWAGILEDLTEVIARARDHVQSGSDAQAQLARLAAIVAQHFARGQRSVVEAPRKARTVAIRHPRSLEGTTLSVNRAGGAQTLPLHAPPECASCRELLLPVVIEPVAGRAEVSVSCPKCGAPTALNLSAWFTTWFTKTGEARPTFGVWTDRAIYWADGPGLPPPMPPAAAIEGTTVSFEYPRTVPRIAHRELPAERRLTLRIAGAPIEALTFERVAFTRPLWPGRERIAEAFSVTPLRPAHLDLLTAPPEWVEPAVAPLSPALKLALKGLPAPIRFTPSGGFERMADLGLAVWPHPRRVGRAWRWYRLATSAGVELSADGAEAIVPGLSQAQAGLPEQLTLQVANADSGCTLSLERERLAPESRGTVEVELGIDFGTTNSLVYAARRSADMLDERAFEPHRLREQVLLAVRPGTEAAQEALLDRFLPRLASGDLATVPSELCAHGLIHWAATPCCPGERVSTMFKGEPQAAETRRRYLLELCTHALADFVSHLLTPPERLDILAVFAYPLSLTLDQRRAYQETARSVLDSLVQLGPVSRGSAAQFVDESTAGIVSVGQPHADDVLLAADLGGGTLDVSIGRGTRGEHDQIGALICGGNAYLKALSAGSASELRKLQQLIRSSPEDARARLSKPEASRLLERYTGHLLFFLETMVASYVLRVRPEPRDAPVPVKLYLLGNGWGFFRFLAKAGDDAEHVWREGIAGLIRRMQEDLRELLGREVRMSWARGERPPKHAVAHGALKMAQAQDGAREAAPEVALPAGISFEVRTGDLHFHWHERFGPATDRNPALRDRVLDDTVTFDLGELRQRCAVARVLPPQAAPADDVADVIRQSLLAAGNKCGGVTPTGYYRGPLQLLIEHWTAKLGG